MFRKDKLPPRSSKPQDMKPKVDTPTNFELPPTTNPSINPSQGVSTTQVPSTTALTVRNELILPLATPEQIKQQREDFDKLKLAVLRPSDYQEIVVRGKKRKFVKKSGWRLLALAFNISDETVSTERVILDAGSVYWIVSVKAIAPNGRFAIGTAGCSNTENGKANMKEQDIMATAQTRAKNRAISDLIAFGEVSAEEMM